MFSLRRAFAYICPPFHYGLQIFYKENKKPFLIFLAVRSGALFILFPSRPDVWRNLPFIDVRVFTSNGDNTTVISLSLPP